MPVHIRAGRATHAGVLRLVERRALSQPGAGARGDGVNAAFKLG
jgi:hypothetical protein